MTRRNAKPRGARRRGTRRSTPVGEHRPVLVDEVLRVLDPQSGEIAVDCTLGFAGHAAALLERLGPTGKLIGLDWDAEHLPRARERLEAAGLPFSVRRTNFAALPTVLAAEGVDAADVVLADLGMSSMQLDDAARGFSYVRDGPLDMRMDRSRGRTAAEVLAAISESDLASALRELGDEPHSLALARTIVVAREQSPIRSTTELARLVGDLLGRPTTRDAGWRLHARTGGWTSHPAARMFQTLRLLVNRELANLQELLRVLPSCLRARGRVAIISFHSGEDRLVKDAFRDGRRAGWYSVAGGPLRATAAEKFTNPRARSAKLRWVVASSARTP